MELDVLEYHVLSRPSRKYYQRKVAIVNGLDRAKDIAKMFCSQDGGGGTVEVVAFGRNPIIRDTNETRKAGYHPSPKSQPSVLFCQTIAKFRNVNGKVEEMKDAT